MNNRILTLFFGLAISAFGIQVAEGQELVIDNFISNNPTRAKFASGERTIRKVGDRSNIVGGVRTTIFGVQPLEESGPSRPTLFDIDLDGPMFVESGVNSSVGVQLNYGLARNGGPNPLDLHLIDDGYNKFRIEFIACDLELNYFIEVFDRDGNHALLSGVGIESTANRNLPFPVDFPFSEFVSAPNPVNWNEIDSIVVQFSTGNATGGQDFAIRKISALPE
jgi:hypothetical protein